MASQTNLTGLCLFSGGENTLHIALSRNIEYLLNSEPVNNWRHSIQTSHSTSFIFSKDRSKHLMLTEHLYAAGLFCTGWEVNSEKNEIPIFDGSAKLYWDWIKKNDRVRLPKLYDVDVAGKIEFDDGYLSFEPSDMFSIDYQIDYKKINNCSSFQSDQDPSSILEARTFISEDFLNQRLNDQVFKNAQKGMGIVIDSEGNLLEGEFRSAGELAQHKILDLLGDLALIKNGLPRVNIKCVNGNHQRNHLLVERILKNVTN